MFLGSPSDMNPPVEYVRFTQRRRLWQELGMTPESEHGETMEALTFMRLEDKYRKQEEKK